jgi:hypothetical protein
VPEHAARRPPAGHGTQAALPPDVHPPAPTRLGEVTWLDPYPDVLLDELADSRPGPEAQAVTREAISLAFVARPHSAQDGVAGLDVHAIPRTCPCFSVAGKLRFAWLQIA